jgi:hypothetical protein
VKVMETYPWGVSQGRIRHVSRLVREVLAQVQKGPPHSFLPNRDLGVRFLTEN